MPTPSAPRAPGSPPTERASSAAPVVELNLVVAPRPHCPPLPAADRLIASYLRCTPHCIIAPPCACGCRPSLRWNRMAAQISTAVARNAAMMLFTPRRRRRARSPGLPLRRAYGQQLQRMAVAALDGMEFAELSCHSSPLRRPARRSSMFQRAEGRIPGDIGGTFTDIPLGVGAERRTRTLPTTPSRP